MMNRNPVPEVRASAFWVTPSPFRVSRTSLPMSCGVYFIAFIHTITLPYGNILAVWRWKSMECYRTGTCLCFWSLRGPNVPAREQGPFHLYILSEGSCIGLRFELQYFEALRNLS